MALGITAPQDEEEGGADDERPKVKGRQKGGRAGKGRGAVPFRHKSAAHRGGRGGKR